MGSRSARRASRFGFGGTLYPRQTPVKATALIVGVGGIGAEAARLAAAFEMRVIGVDGRPQETPPGVAELRGPDALDSLLPRADFVILTVTWIQALRAGEIADAGLDVFEQEPLPADHPLWTMLGVLITRFEILLDNCRRFLAGQPLRNVVDKARWF